MILTNVVRELLAVAQTPIVWTPMDRTSAHARGASPEMPQSDVSKCPECAPTERFVIETLLVSMLGETASGKSQ